MALKQVQEATERSFSRLKPLQSPAAKAITDMATEGRVVILAVMLLMSGKALEFTCIDARLLL